MAIPDIKSYYRPIYLHILRYSRLESGELSSADVHGYNKTIRDSHNHY
jgi:hypothetical protein